MSELAGNDLDDQITAIIDILISRVVLFGSDQKLYATTGPLADSRHSFLTILTSFKFQASNLRPLRPQASKPAKPGLMHLCGGAHRIMSTHPGHTIIVRIYIVYTDLS